MKTPEQIGITSRGWFAVLVLVLIQLAVIFVAASFARSCFGAEPVRPSNPIAELAPWFDDVNEPARAREVRLDFARAEAVVRAEEEHRWKGSKRMLAALVLSIGWYETRFARAAERGECPTKGGCDRGKAWHYYQTHTPDDLREDGWLGLSRATQEAIRILRQGANHCGGVGRERWLRAVSLYATGKTCHWSGAEERVALAERIVRKL